MVQNQVSNSFYHKKFLFIKATQLYISFLEKGFYTTFTLIVMVDRSMITGRVGHKQVRHVEKLISSSVSNATVLNAARRNFREALRLIERSHESGIKQLSRRKTVLSSRLPALERGRVEEMTRRLETNLDQLDERRRKINVMARSMKIKL
jgi:hypothetical protein